MLKSLRKKAKTLVDVIKNGQYERLLSSYEFLKPIYNLSGVFS